MQELGAEWVRFVDKARFARYRRYTTDEVVALLSMRP